MQLLWFNCPKYRNHKTQHLLCTKAKQTISLITIFLVYKFLTYHGNIFNIFICRNLNIFNYGYNKLKTSEMNVGCFLFQTEGYKSHFLHENLRPEKKFLSMNSILFPVTKLLCNGYHLFNTYKQQCWHMCTICKH